MTGPGTPRGRPLTIGIAWNGIGDPAPLLDRVEIADFVHEVLISPTTAAVGAKAAAIGAHCTKLRILPPGDSGIYSAWNKLIGSTTTAFLCFHGVDDLLRPDPAIGEALRHGERAIHVFTLQLCRADGTPIMPHHHEERDPPSSRLGRATSPATPEIAYPVAILRAIGGADESFRIAGDVDLYFRARAIAARRDHAPILADMCDGGASTTARHARTVFHENRRIARAFGQPVGFAAILVGGAFLLGRYWLYRIGGERFSAIMTDGLRLLLGKRPRYSVS